MLGYLPMHTMPLRRLFLAPRTVVLQVPPLLVPVLLLHLLFLTPRTVVVQVLPLQIPVALLLLLLPLLQRRRSNALCSTFFRHG